MKPRILAILSVFALLPYLVFGLFPRELPIIPQFFVNHAEVEAGKSLRFVEPGIVKVRNSAAWLDSAIAGDQFRIDLRVQPFSGRASGPARILTLSANSLERNLTVAQNGGALVVRMRRAGTDINGEPDIVIPDVFEEERRVDIRVLYENDMLRIYVDDREVERLTIVPGALEGWSTRYQMAMGNELTTDRPWFGSIEWAFVSAGVVRLDLLAPQNHEIPAYVFTLTHSHGNQADIILNFLGFFPLGLLLAFWAPSTRWPTFVLLVLVIGSISAGIEAFQLALPNRSTSFRDLGLNLLGGAFGVMLGTLLPIQRRRTRRTGG